MASVVASESALANWLYMFVEYNDGLKELVENVGCDGVVNDVGVVNTLVGFFDDVVKGVVFNVAGGETQLVSVGVVVVGGGGT